MRATEKLDRIYEMSRCYCLRARAKLINIRGGG